MIQSIKNSFIDVNKINHPFTIEQMKTTHHFHASIPNYKPTPLHHLEILANSLSVSEIVVKDEAHRFGLNAFKSLGAAFAMANYFAKQLQIELTDFPRLLEKVAEQPRVTFATVTAGNHGRGVAWAAQIFGQKAKVFLPKGSAQSRLEAIQALGADAEIVDVNYDDAVAAVAKLADEKEWVLMQDTAWSGYEEIPQDIMQGYTTIISEIVEQLHQETLSEFTHIFLQAGVGSFAAAMVTAILQQTIVNPPHIIIVEPDAAACYYQSANGEGVPQRVRGDLATMMAGLACGEPNPFAWEILKTSTDYIFSCDDTVSATGMRLYAKENIVAGESGAVTLGLLHELMTDETLKAERNQLNLNQDSKILLINTEGNTNPSNYEKIMKG